VTTPGELAARFLRQRAELGAGHVVLERLSAEEALAWIRRAREAGPVPAATGAPAAAARRLPAEAPDRGAGGPDLRSAPGDTDAGVPEGASLPTDHEALRDICLGCTRCRLAEGRTQVVFADGNPAARVLVVGEAPGANEDATGRPFVGAAGKLLDLLLAAVDLSREDSVYICNVIKCRPPGNRNPRPDEIDACSPYLRAQIQAVQPEAILAVGTFAGQLLTGEGAPLGRLRGKVHAYEGTPMVVTYHPAALLRNSGWTRATWDDLQLLRHVLDEL
jgi:uracil-DNA glycosylase